MTARNNQTGAGLIGLILVLVILGLLAFTVWNAYQARNQPAETPASGQTNESSVSPIDRAKNLGGPR